MPQNNVTMNEANQSTLTAHSKEEADSLLREWLDNYTKFLKTNYLSGFPRREYHRDSARPNSKNEPPKILSSLPQLEVNAEAGHMPTQAALARYYRKYNDTDIQQKAFHFAEMAAKNGDIRSKFFLATYLTEGSKGATRDLQQAAALLDEVFKAGEKFKQQTLKVYVIRHPEVKPHLKTQITCVAQKSKEADEAVKKFLYLWASIQMPMQHIKEIKMDRMEMAIVNDQVRVNAEAGHLLSQLTLKDHYKSNFFSSNEIKEELLHFTELAASNGHLNSKFELACLYTEGYINSNKEVVARDLKKAANLFKELRETKNFDQEKVEQYLSKHPDLDNFMREDLSKIFDITLRIS